MSHLSILQNFTPAKLTMEPYPYLVIDEALPDRLYRQLSEAYPSVETIFRHAHRNSDREVKPNSRYDLSAAEVLADADLALGPWREFVAYHTSQAFFEEFMDKLAPAITAVYPQFAGRMAAKAPGGRSRAGVRRRDDRSAQCEIALDCQIGINSPSPVGGTKVIGPHIDNPKELFAGLFYLKDEADRAAGGDFVLYRWKDDKQVGFYQKRYVADDLVEAFATVPYGANRFVLVINSLDAVHGVTAREASLHPRRLCNIIAETYPTLPRLFDVSRYQTDLTLTKRVANWFRR